MAAALMQRDGLDACVVGADRVVANGAGPWKPGNGDFFERDSGRMTSSIFKYHIISRWWFQIFFIFIPTWGKDPI